MDLRALLFDINSTVIDIETDEAMEEIYRAIAHFLTYQGISLHRGEVRGLYFQVMKEQFEASREKYPEFDVVKVWQEILSRQGTAYTNAQPNGKLQQLPLVLAEMQRAISRKRLRCYPQVLEVLSELKRRYPLAAVSDAQTAYAIPELRAAGLDGYFDPVIVSGYYGYRKPDVRMFQHALGKLNVTPRQAIFIGNDRYRDIFGAQQLQIKTILFSQAAAPAAPGEAEPDYIIYQFAELPKAVEFLAAQ
jgi:putative hydrolase of the HAD superfamily